LYHNEKVIQQNFKAGAKDATLACTWAFWVGHSYCSSEILQMLLIRAINYMFSNDINCPVRDTSDLPSERSFVACYNLCEIFSVSYATVFSFFDLFLADNGI